MKFWSIYICVEFLMLAQGILYVYNNIYNVQIYVYTHITDKNGTVHFIIVYFSWRAWLYSLSDLDFSGGEIIFSSFTVLLFL